MTASNFIDKKDLVLDIGASLSKPSTISASSTDLLPIKIAKSICYDFLTYSLIAPISPTYSSVDFYFFISFDKSMFSIFL